MIYIVGSRSVPGVESRNGEEGNSFAGRAERERTGVIFNGDSTFSLSSHRESCELFSRATRRFISLFSPRCVVYLFVEKSFAMPYLVNHELTSLRLYIISVHRRFSKLHARFSKNESWFPENLSLGERGRPPSIIGVSKQYLTRRISYRNFFPIYRQIFKEQIEPCPTVQRRGNSPGIAGETF